MKREAGGRRSPFPEFRPVPGAMRATPTGEVVDVESRELASPMTLRPRRRLSWAEEVEQAEEVERVEKERQAKPTVERKRVEREKREVDTAASGMVDRQRAERVRLEMERLRRVRAEKERKEKERTAQRKAEERAVAQFEREEAERRRAEREERKSLEKERVERIGGRMEPIVELPEATCSVASVASSSLIADEVEGERGRRCAERELFPNDWRVEAAKSGILASRRWTRRPLQMGTRVETEARGAKRSG